jgi:hypothetical protein
VRKTKARHAETRGVSGLSLHEIISAAIEVLKILAWPAVVGLICFFLRHEVKRVAPRITELTWSGAKFAPLPDQIPSPTGGGISGPSGPSLIAESGALSVTGSKTEAAKTAPSSDAAQRLIANLKSFISEDQLEPTAQAIRRELTDTIGTDQKNQIEALIYALAARNVAIRHEQNYSAIFGSQLQLLEQMIVEPGVPPIVARQIYDAARSANPEAYRAYPFEQWIAFLQNSGLTTAAPTGNYVLTPYGRGFLKYILDRRLSVNKPF